MGQRFLGRVSGLGGRSSLLFSSSSLLLLLVLLLVLVDVLLPVCLFDSLEMNE
jgi:hypothetical protein